MTGGETREQAGRARQPKPVLARVGDVFGPVVNIAARLTSLARHGRILVVEDNAPLRENLALLLGGDGQDTIIAGAGRDTLDGGPNPDVLQGGAGDDVYLTDDAADSVVENPGEGIDEVRSSASFTLAANVENLTLIAATGNSTGTGNLSVTTATGTTGSPSSCSVIVRCPVELIGRNSVSPSTTPRTRAWK